MHFKFDLTTYSIWFDFQDGIKNVKFTEDGMRTEGQVEFLDSLYTENIQSLQVNYGQKGFSSTKKFKAGNKISFMKYKDRNLESVKKNKLFTVHIRDYIYRQQKSNDANCVFRQAREIC